MFISRRTHDEMTSLLRERISELTRERDFFLEQYTKLLGKPFVAQPTVRDEIHAAGEQRHDEALERAELLRTGWTHEDFLMFADQTEERQDKSLSADEWWIKHYGYKRPSEVLVTG